MKKLKKSISTYLPTAKIFLDDVEKIEEILRESCTSYNLPFNEPKLDKINEDEENYKLFELHPYTIKLDEEYELYSISEIKEIDDRQDFHNLEILLMKPYFRLEFDEFNSHIYCNDDSLCLGIIERIKPIILKRKRDFQLGKYILIFLLVFLCVINSLDLFMNLYSDSIAWIIIGTTFLTIIICSKLIFFKDDNSEFIVFTTKKSNEHSNYFIENKDELITKLFFGIITTAIGIFIGNKVLPWFQSLLKGL